MIYSKILNNFLITDNKMYKYRTDGSNLVQGILSSGSLAIDTHFFLWYVCFVVNSLYVRCLQSSLQQMNLKENIKNLIKLSELLN